MQKITLTFIFLALAKISLAQISYTDIPDGIPPADTNSATEGIDFDQDGTNEFDVDAWGMMAPGDGIMYWNYGLDNNIHAIGTFATGQWDVPKFENAGFIIDASGNWEGAGDASLDDWGGGNPTLTPNVDTYMCVRFNLAGGTDVYYGWVRIMMDGAGNFIYKDYAYNTTPNEAITAGQTVLSIEDFNNGLQVSLYPNPTTDFINLQGQITVAKANLINLLGKTKAVKVTNNKIDVRNNTKGVYFLQVITNTNKTATKKIIIH